MGVVVQFNYGIWATRFPALGAKVDEPTALVYFNEATMFQRNDGCGPISNAGVQLKLLNLLTAHIATINTPATPGRAVTPLVGRIGQATQGSVSATVEYNTSDTSDLAAWANQTPFGAEWYAALSSIRTARYIPGRQRIFDPLTLVRGPWPR